MLNPVAKKWVAALRSGEYKQGKSRLRTNSGKHCCLGVLADLAVKDGVVPSFPDGLYLPEGVREWAGLRDNAGQYDQGNANLAAQNDLYERSFSQIANIIESEPEGLFV